MSDRINIDGILVFANHGVLAEEVSLGQKFIISLVLNLSLNEAGRNDDLNATVNYATVCDFVNKYVKSHTYKLIETVAQKIAEELLLQYEQLESVEVTVKKPWAPIGYPLECVSVCIKRGWHDVYLSIGSNMGDKIKNLDFAIDELKKVREIKGVMASSYINTKPYGMTEQDDFANGAVKLKTLLSPQEMLKVVNEIEARAGRERTIHWGPRTLDIDIVLYDDLIINESNLIIPHADMANREFVLKPLSEIAPHVIHPVKRMSIVEMLKEL